jgi:hypothetical protein
MERTVTKNTAAEWSFVSARDYAEPFNDIELDAVFTGPDGTSLRVPAFWAGGREWRVRFSTDKTGKWNYRTECSDRSDAGLHGVWGELAVVPYEGDNALYSHGPLRVSSDGRYFEHADKTPFFWLGDTWWSLMTERVSWPEGFQKLTKDRKNKGFTVIQTVVGLNPETLFDDPRNANEGGQPWDAVDGEYRSVRPAYFNAADRRIFWLLDQGIVPCIVGSWGYHLRWLSVEKMKKHWRYLVARYGAYPVFWCLAGEVMMPYESYTGGGPSAKARAEWSSIAKYLRSVDAYRRPLTLHPFGGTASWDNVEQDDLLDFQMLQPGHGPNGCAVETGVRLVTMGRNRSPVKPVVNGEPPYEGHLQSNYHSTSRMAFWTGFILGQAGHTYGAAGIFCANDSERPVGSRPEGGAYDNIFWDEAMHFPGSAQVGIAKKLLCRYQWWRFEPHPEWAEISADVPRDWYRPEVRAYAAGIPGEIRIIYTPTRLYCWEGPAVKGLELGVKYRAFYFDPIQGKEYPIAEVQPDDGGNWQAPMQPYCQDWVLVLERRNDAGDAT